MFPSFSFTILTQCSLQQRNFVKSGVGFSRAKPSTCFRSLEKLVLPSIFDKKVFHPSCCGACRVVQCPTTVLSERMWHFRGLRHADPSCIFSESQDPLTPHDLRPWFSLQGSCARKYYKIQGFTKPFHSIIQGQFNALLPVNHSIAYSPTDTQEKRRTDLKHWWVIFISKAVWAFLLPSLQQLW